MENLNLKELQELFKLLQENHGKKAVNLAEWLKKENIKGFSTATISNIRRGKSAFPKAKLKAHLIKYIEYLVNLNSSNQADKKIKTFNKTVICDITNLYLNKSFYLYHFNEDNDSKKKCISRLILSIGNSLDDVMLINVPHRDNTDYKGYFFLNEEKRHISFALKTLISNERDLKISFIRSSNDQLPSIMLGLYHLTNNKGALVGGTLVFSLINEEEKPSSMNIYYGTEEYEKIPKEIRYYLAEKSFNKIKVTTGIFSLNDLREFIERQEIKEFKININDLIESLTSLIFFSAPMSSLSTEDYLMFRNECLSYIKELKTNCESEIYAPIEIYEKTTDFLHPRVAFDTDINKLSESSKFVMIYPKELPSSILFEVGYAFAQKKACAIFVHEDCHLPFMLKYANNSYLNIHRYRTHKDIIDLIRTLKTKLFPIPSY